MNDIEDDTTARIPVTENVTFPIPTTSTTPLPFDDDKAPFHSTPKALTSSPLSLGIPTLTAKSDQVKKCEKCKKYQKDKKNLKRKLSRMARKIQLLNEKHKSYDDIEKMCVSESCSITHLITKPFKCSY